MLAVAPVSFCYADIVNSTCAGRPLSVMNTGPRLAAFFAPLVS